METEALLCGHTFHQTCVLGYMSATGKSRREACPYKCRITDADIEAVTGVLEDTDAVESEDEAQVADLDDIAAAAADAEAEARRRVGGFPEQGVGSASLE